MKSGRKTGRALVASTALGAMAMCAITLIAPGARADRPPGPLCGPTILWVCSGPGGPLVLFGGTVCEKVLFEEETGLTCVPYGG
jgi:hypothetical protein